MDDNQNKKRILLADDDPFIARVYGDGLQNAGYEVITASDGDEALDKMRNERPDLVVLDIIMPKQNGFEVLKAAQADELLSDIPVMVLTNLSQASDEEEAKRYGAIDFMTKSDVSFNEVLVRVEQWFANNPSSYTNPPSQTP